MANPQQRTWQSANSLLVIGLLVAAGCSHTSMPPAAIDATTSGPPVIAPGVTAGGIPIGGMTNGAARSFIASVVANAKQKLVIGLHDKASHRTFHYTFGDLGGTVDVDKACELAARSPAGTAINVPLNINIKSLLLHLHRIAALTDVPVMEPKVKYDAEDNISTRPGINGRKLDIALAEQSVINAPISFIKQVPPINLPYDTVHPAVKVADVSGLDDRLASFTTTFHPSQAERTNNLELAARNINGTVVGPGEVFSYNDSVGPRTHETGFQDAIIYVNNQMKKDVGGGICQVSSTLYNCALMANFPIVERHCHSLPVHYVPAGRDATVAWGSDDFRFRNTCSKPVVVRAIVDGGTLSEYIIGDRSSLPHPNAQVAISVSPKRTYPDGFAVTAYRLVSEQGTLIARDPLGTSFYHIPVGPVPH